jgi:hypothetical protein
MHYGSPQWYESYYSSLEDVLPGYSFVQTTNGYFGLAPTMATQGDKIYVILGCHVPMILRAKKDGNFAVVGHCYLKGHMEAKALLGQLPDGWRVVYFGSVEAGMWFAHEQTGIFTRNDPRLGSLPPN